MGSDSQPASPPKKPSRREAQGQVPVSLPPPQPGDNSTEGRYRELFHRNLAGVYRSTVDGDFIDCNDSFARMFGYADREEALASRAWQLYSCNQDRDSFLAALYQHKNVSNFESCLQRRDGKPIWVLENASLLEGGPGTQPLIQGTVIDITDRKRAEEELRRSQQKLALHVQHTPLGVVEWNVNMDVVEWNPSAERIFGYSREEALGKSAEFIVPSSATRQVKKIIQDMFKGTGGTRSSNENVTKDGRIILCEWYNTSLKDSSDRVIGVASLVLDVTERLHTEKALRESDIKFRAVADTVSSAIYIKNAKQFLYVNRASQSITGYSREELMAMHPLEIVHPDSREMVNRRDKACMTGLPVPDRYEYRIRTKNGDVRWLDFSASIIDFEGQPATLGTAFDITERKRVEQLQSALYRIADNASSTESLEELFPAVHNIVGELMYARNFYIALFDPKFNLMTFPYFVDEKESTKQSRPLGKGLTEYVLRTSQTALVTPELFEKLRKQGEVVESGAPSVDWLGAPLKAGPHTFGVLALQSYTEEVRFGEREKELLTFVSQHVASAIDRKRNEERIRFSEARYRSLIDRAVYGIYRASLQDEFLDANPALVSMLGYDTREQLLEKMISKDIYVEPEESARLRKNLLQKKIVNSVESRWKRKDGKIITVRLSGRLVSDDQTGAQVLEMIAEDVTERRGLEDQLRQSVKMEAVGRLAGGVAHDFNNLLTVIRGYSELLAEEMGSEASSRQKVDEINKAADRAATLTRQLLAFSRRQVLESKVIDLNVVVRNMDLLMRRLLGDEIDLNFAFNSTSGRVKADPGQIEQVIMNLAVNARDAMPGRGKLTVETADVTLDKVYSHDHVAMNPGKYVMLAVSDNGTGMNREIQARIFEPFFTTKEQGKGTGLGLSTVYGIVKQSGGYIWVYSEPGLGSSFKVYLPRVDEPVETVAVESENHPLDKGSETVLLVEDEDGVRGLMAQVLKRQGYNVLESSDGDGALKHCHAYSGRIDLLLTDVVLEKVSGRQLAEDLRKKRPQMRVLFVSGYTDDAIVHHGLLTSNTAFLQKPFTTDGLVRKVRSVLDGNLEPEELTN